MTLIIGGYEINEFEDVTTFIIADSAITRITTYKNPTNNEKTTEVKTLLNGYRKFYAIDLKIKHPKFNNSGFFEKYHEILTYGKCVIAFAGGKDTAHHIINSIQLNLSNLKIALGDSTSIYLVPMGNDTPQEIIKSYAQCWDVDLYDFSDVHLLLDKKFISTLIKRVISESVSSAREYKIDEEGIKDLECEFLVSIYCEKTRRNYLFKYAVTKKMSGDIFVPDVEMREIGRNELVYIGVPEYGKEMIKCHHEFISSPDFSKVIQCEGLGSDNFELIANQSIFNFMKIKFNEVVKKCSDNNYKIIDFPVFGLNIDRTKVELKTYTYER
ncbi:TPA: hypothetical protein L9T05_004934 [Klebsiella pneumoniae]|nr:hypothetical protein [Klebsiella pneumoniae]HBR3729163.1 hypothetical protein [Klebsiella pneumoniae]